MVRGILLGSVSGLALSGLFLISVSLLVPPAGGAVTARVPDRPDAVIPPSSDETQVTRPAPLPERTAPEADALAEGPSADAIDLPVGSGFGRAREDVAVVTPTADARPQLAAASGPEGPTRPPEVPVADTRSAAVPGQVQFTALAPPPEDGAAPARPAVVEARAPETFRFVDPEAEGAAVAESLVELPEDGGTAGDVSDGVAEGPATELPSPAPETELAALTSTDEAPVISADAGGAEGAATSLSRPDEVLAVVAPADGAEALAEDGAGAFEVAALAPLQHDLRVEETTSDAFADLGVILRAATEAAEAEADQLAPDEPGPAIAETAPTAPAGPDGETTPGIEVASLDLDGPNPAPGVPLVVSRPGPDLDAAGATLAEDAAPLALPEVSQTVPSGGPIAGEDGVFGLEETPDDGAVDIAQLESGDIRIVQPEDVLIPERTPAPVVVEDAAPAAVADTPAPASGTGGALPRRLVLDSERAAQAASEPADVVADPAPGRALEAFAATVERRDGLPGFSIVLIDDPASGLAREDVAALDLPVSVAIDPTAPDAAEAMAFYRGAGREVLLLADALDPEGAPQDIEIALAGARAALPEAVGVLDRAEAGFAGQRPALTVLLPALQEAGLGFLSYPGGLGSGVQTALREGVPAAQLYRVLDDRGQSAPMIGRFLDRATFEAAQGGTPIVVGRTAPETVEALQTWAAGDRVETVDVLPVSAVLRGTLP